MIGLVVNYVCRVWLTFSKATQIHSIRMTSLSIRIVLCHVPNPPTGEEDVTMALTIQAKSPMNMGIHKICWNIMLKQMLWTRACTHEHLSCIDAIVHHTQLQSSIRHNGNIIHSYKHSPIMFITFINKKYGCISKNGQDHLSYEEVILQPATSLQISTQP